MADTDFRALCEQLMELAEGKRYDGSIVIAKARAALAQPEEPTDKELLRVAASVIDPYESSGIAIGEYEPEIECAIEVYGSELIAFARAVLACYGTPANQPVLVSERLPGPENKTTDDECWFWDPISGCWFLLPGPPLNDHYTHWLPHHSLPIPRGGTHFDDT